MGGGEGGSPKADIVREVAWIYSYRSDQNADKGGEGVKNPKNFADVLYVWPLIEDGTCPFMVFAVIATRAGIARMGTVHDKSDRHLTL